MRLRWLWAYPVVPACFCSFLVLTLAYQSFVPIEVRRLLPPDVRPLLYGGWIQSLSLCLFIGSLVVWIPNFQERLVRYRKARNRLAGGCENCGYLNIGWSSSRCPECGSVN